MGPPYSAAAQYMFTQYIFTQYIYTAFYGRIRKNGNSPKKTTRFHDQSGTKEDKRRTIRQMRAVGGVLGF